MILREIKNMYFPALQQIEYLESTKDYMQYIDTGVKIDSETAFIGTTIDFQILTTLDGSSVVAGSVLSEGPYMYQNTECLVYNGVFYTYGGFNFSQNSDIYARTLATSNGKAKGISNLNLVLFAMNVKGLGISRVRVSTECTCRIFSCTIRKNGDIIRDFIPVRIGTKGYMLDKVSGELYGNSGTGDFLLGQDVGSINYSKNLQQIYQNKLIEGVDYETADWLKADIPISTSMMSLPLNSKNFEFKRNWIQVMNSSYFRTYENSYPSYVYHLSDVSTNERNPRIWNSKTSSLVYRSPIVVGLGIHTITANDSGIIISSATNTATLPWYGDGTTTTVVFNNANNINKNTIHLTSSIKVDGVTRYVPCQLLHSIPRNLDAQCKERVAGECGMIDLISGKFYGNVANSGTFTVENDNNE